MISLGKTWSGQIFWCLFEGDICPMVQKDECLQCCFPSVCEQELAKEGDAGLTQGRVALFTTFFAKGIVPCSWRPFSSYDTLCIHHSSNTIQCITKLGLSNVSAEYVQFLYRHPLLTPRITVNVLEQGQVHCKPSFFAFHPFHSQS